MIEDFPEHEINVRKSLSGNKIVSGHVSVKLFELRLERVLAVSFSLSEWSSAWELIWVFFVLKLPETVTEANEATSDIDDLVGSLVDSPGFYGKVKSQHSFYLDGTVITYHKSQTCIVELLSDVELSSNVFEHRSRLRDLYIPIYQVRQVRKCKSILELGGRLHICPFCSVPVCKVRSVSAFLKMRWRTRLD